jgi:anti-anti-sigma factor
MPLPTPADPIHYGAIVPDELTCYVERDTPYAVVRISGALELTSAAKVRRVIAKCLASQPTMIVLCVDGLRIGDPAALAVFASAANEVAQWPGAPVVLCAPEPEIRKVISGSAVCRHVPVYPTMEEAMAGVDQTPPVQLSTRLLPAVGAARRARELVTEACARWELPHLAGPACTVVTELVNNVVVHAHSSMDVTLRLRDRHVTVSVRDESTDPPRPRGPVSPTSPGGRGLMMVAAVAERWGHTAMPDGKVVWAVLRTDDSRH